MPIITNGKITISIADENDVDRLIAWWRNPKLMCDVGFPNGVESNRTRLLNLLNEQCKLKFFQRKSCRYIISIKSLGDKTIPIGELCFNNMDLYHKSCEIGIKICELEWQNMGIGYETLKIFLPYLFVEYDLNRIELSTLAENKRAQALYHKLEFAYNGIKRQCFRDSVGKFHDIVMMDLLRSEIQLQD